MSPHAPDPWNEKKQFQLDSLIYAEAFWEDVEECGGENPGYRRSGRLQTLATERALERARTYSVKSRENWRNCADWNLVRDEEFGRWAPNSPTGWLAFDTLSARIHPRLSLSSLAAAIRNLSGEIIEGRTEGFGAGSTILATGWEGFATLENELGIPLGCGEKGQAALLKFHAPDQPQIYADGLHIVPHRDGFVGIGSTSERSYALANAPDSRLESLISLAKQVAPFLKNAEIVGRWASVRPRANSRSPLLGRHPLSNSIFVANGGFKIGYGIAPGVSRAMADLVLDGINGIPESFTLEQSFLEKTKSAGS